MTTIYLIRHSVRMKENIINEYNTNQDKTIRKDNIKCRRRKKSRNFMQ